MDLNKVMLIGRLTRDPEVKTTPQGVTVTTFGLATGRVWKDAQGNQQDKTEFHNIVAWRRLGEIAGQYLGKGRQIYIEGHLQTRSWESEPGKKQYRTEVVADNMIMLGNKGDNTGSSASAPAYAKAPAGKPASQQSPEEITAAPVGEDEIRIEDIPF